MASDPRHPNTRGGRQMIIASIRTEHPDNGIEIWKRTFPQWAEAQAFADLVIGLPDNSNRTPVFIGLFDTETHTQQDYYLQGANND
jgi:hypothetical protein